MEKDISDLVVCVADFGYFTCLAQKFAESAKKVYYHSPCEDEFQSVHKCVIGDGLPDVERLDDIYNIDTFDDIDLFVFPDVGFAETQRYLREVGKLVCGAFGMDHYEKSRSAFLELLEDLELNVAPWKKCVGVSALAKELKNRGEPAYVKLNRFRSDMESWKHEDWAHSEREIERLAKLWGGVKEHPTFVVQDIIESDAELGYDGWTVEGEFPVRGFAGYEDKNELYLGALREYEDLPKQIREVNEAMAPILKEYGYRNFFSTEIRVKDGDGYFIDPTLRMPGQTGEQLTETCSNLLEVTYAMARGELIEPKFEFKFAASATMNYSASAPEDWKVLRVPEEAKRWTKLGHFVYADGLYHFPPGKSVEIGVVVAGGDSFEEVLKNLKENLELYSDQPVSYELDGFYDLVKQIKAAEDQGAEFSDESPPEPAEAIGMVLG